MTGVWQTLIPETPSTEPIASHLDDGLIPASPREPTIIASGGGEGCSDRGMGMGMSRGGGVSTISGTAESIHHRHQNNVNNNISHPHSNHHPHHSHLLTKTNSRTSNSAKTTQGISRFPSMPCGEQLWKFYTNHVKNRKKKETRRRVLLKNGLRNLCQINVREKPRRYWNDMFTTLVDARWRYTLFIFSCSYVMSWIGFAIVWWVIVTAHEDLKRFGENGWKPCVEGVHNFASVFLFSVETQHTIGYGYHRVTAECPDAVVVLCLQSIAGVLIEALMVGVVFAKLSRPKKRSQTIIFSRKAVICLRDGQLYLMFRVGDIRRSHILEAHVRAQVITKRTTSEGEVLPIHQEEIKVGGYGEDEDRILLFWPTTIVHPIDSESPLYEMSAGDLLKAKLEVMVIMEGVVESTGMTTQARTSFLPSEILWGHRFHSTTSYKSEYGHHLVDFSLFNATFPVDTPLCSAQHLDSIKQMKADGLTGREILATLTENNGSTVSFANGPTPTSTLMNSMNSPTHPNGGCCPLVDTCTDSLSPLTSHHKNQLQQQQQNQNQNPNQNQILNQSQNHILKEAILMSTPGSVCKNAKYSISRRNSNISPNLPNNIPRSRLASPIKAVIGAPGAEYLDDSTDSNNEEDDDEEERDRDENDEDDDDDDDDDGYVEHSTCKGKGNHRASRKESREAMLRAHSNSSSSITSESNV